MDELHLILMAGLPGSGKSAVAREIGKALGSVVIDKDVILSSMLDVIPEHLAQPSAYAALLALGRELVVNQRQSVILDSPATWERTVKIVQEIGQEAGARLHVVLCLASQETRNQRVRTRHRQKSQPAGFSTTAGTGAERFHYLPSDTITVNTEGTLQSAVESVLRQIGYIPGS